MDIKHDEELQKFFYMLETEEAHLLYRKNGEILDFYSTYVPSEGRGQGLAKKLVDAGVEFVKENNFQIKATCSYVEKYFQKYSEHSELEVK